MYDIYQKFETATLLNGLTVHCLHWPERAGARFEFIIHSGGRHDPIGKEGAAHFMEHLVSENALISNEELQKFFEQNAGEHPQFGTTGPNGTFYGFRTSCESSLLSQSLHYYGDMLFQASLVNEIERERQVILGEYNRKYPMQITYDTTYRMRQAVFSNTFFGRFTSTLGTKESIGTLRQSDLQTFYDTHYTPANMSVIVVGELTLDEAVAALANSPFSVHKTGTRSTRPKTITNPPPPSEAEYRIHEGAHFVGKSAASFGTTAQLPGTFSPALTSIVEEMISKQLFKVIRLEKAWTYHVGCGISFLGDFHEFTATCSSLDARAVEKISAVVSNCIEEIRLQADVFGEIKHKLIVGMKFEDPSVRSVCNAARRDLLLYDRIITLTEELREVEAIQISNIIPVIDSLAADRRWTMIGYP
jgi:predicted Zn-dependent peptidase